MKYLSLFSGYGGFELGIQQAYDNLQCSERVQQGRISGYRDLSNAWKPLLGTEPLCIGYSEVDKYAIQTYQKHFPTHKPYGDITKLDPSTLTDFDILCGGFPCQAFSIAGKRKGFEDTRGTLIYDVFRIIREKHPRTVLLENVKGLLSHDGGRTFKTIITSLAELGYAVEWQVLNAKNFGVPQNRERVFIVGHLGGFGGRQVFPIGASHEVNTQSNGQGNAYCLQAGGDKHRGTYIKQLNQPKHSNDRIYGTDGISPTLNTAQGGNRQPFIQNPKMMNFKKYYENSVAITATSYKEPPFVNSIRRLTPTECERLMGLPDGWTEGVSDTQRYKMAGNGVVINVVEAIVSRLIKNYTTRRKKSLKFTSLRES